MALGAVVLHGLLLAVSGPALAQPPAPPTPPSSAAAVATQSSADQTRLALTGCVPADATAGSRFTLYDPHRGTMYKLTAKGLGRQVNRHVQVIGGLLPTTNVAAQYGSLDPTQVAVANTTMNLFGSGPFNQPKVHVETVRSLQAPCPSP